MSKKGSIFITILFIIGILASLSLVGGGVYYFQEQKANKEKQKIEQDKKKLEEEILNLKKEIEDLQAQIKQREEKQLVDEYAGWKTYANNEIGYTLKYPPDWTLEEVDTYSEIIETKVKYIIINTPDKKYFLHFGIKGPTDNFNTTDRTGVGAGDWEDAGKITILGAEVTITKLVYNNKTKEIFYPGAGEKAKTSDGKYTFHASFGYGGDDYETVDMTNVSYVAIAEKILKSVEIIK